MLINKIEDWSSGGFSWSSGQQRQNKRKCVNIWTLPENKTTVEYAGDGGTNCRWSACNGPQMIGKGIKTVGDRKCNRGHQDYRVLETWEELLSLSVCWCEKIAMSIIIIIKDTEFRPGNHYQELKNKLSGGLCCSSRPHIRRRIEFLLTVL